MRYFFRLKPCFCVVSGLYFRRENHPRMAQIRRKRRTRPMRRATISAPTMERLCGVLACLDYENMYQKKG